MSRPSTPGALLTSRGSGGKLSSPQVQTAPCLNAVAIPAATQAVKAQNTGSASAVKASVGALREDSSWVPIDDDADAGMDQRALSETLATRMHLVFQYTSIPTGVVIGLFLVALLFEEKVEAHSVGRFVSLYCAVMCVIMTGLLMYLHLLAYTNPVQQRIVLRILLMVPVYAVDSCLAIWDQRLAPLIGLARDCYESYVIYNFFYLLMSYLGGEEQALASRAGAKITHKFPLCCLPPFQFSARTLRLWKLMLVQYMLLKPFCALLAMMLTPSGAFDESSWSFRNAHVYFVLILNVSVTCAFTTLVYFFLEFKDLLVAHQPLGKFAAVKAVVFLSFWQGVLMGLLVHVGWIRQSREGLWSSDQVSTGLQDFLICIEMVLMCHVHHRVFSERPYVPGDGYRPIRPWVWRHVLSISDVVEESVATIHHVAEAVTESAENGKTV